MSRAPQMLAVALAAALALPSARALAGDAQSASDFSTRAREFLAAAKAKMEAQDAEQQARDRARQREDAQRLAIEMTRERAERQAAQEREAQRQVASARERQLKTLYQRGLALYHDGAFDEAGKLFQEMALLDPDHALVKAADRLMSRAEMKRFESQLRASIDAPQTQGANLPQLEQLLTRKKVELETALKYARMSMEERDYDTALKLATAVLVQDPESRPAQQLVQQVHLAQLDDEGKHLRRLGARDDAAMDNEILRAQLLPHRRAAAAAGMNASAPVHPSLASKLREPISFEFSDVALSDVLEFVADAASVSIIPSPQLDLKSKRVTLKVKDLPLEQAIKYLAKSLALSYRLERDVILIATAEEFSAEPLQTRVYMLHNGLGPLALETSAVEPNPVLALAPLTELIEKSVPSVPDAKLIVDQRSGALVVTNTAENLRIIERLLSQLDVAPQQILIEARFIELTLNDLEHFSIETVLNDAGVLDKKGVPGGTRGPAQVVSAGSGVTFPALTRESEGLNFTLQSVLTGTQLEMALHALEERQQTKTLSAPRVTTLNNQTASIRVVEEFNYPTRYEVSLIQFDINGDGDFDDAGETEFANVPQDLQKRDIGILLNVTPSVGRDGKTITLVVAPEVSTFSQFRDLGGGVTVPEFTSSQLTTSVVMENGQTVVLGGLMQDTTSDVKTKVPVLGDLPVLGAFFRQSSSTSTRKNLLIFITARVLAPRGETT